MLSTQAIIVNNAQLRIKYVFMSFGSVFLNFTKLLESSGNNQCISSYPEKY